VKDFMKICLAVLELLLGLSEWQAGEANGRSLDANEREET
jgi:hypothetical protein